NSPSLLPSDLLSLHDALPIFVVKRPIRFFFCLFLKPLISFSFGFSPAFLRRWLFFFLFWRCLVTSFKMGGVDSDRIVCDKPFFNGLFDNLLLSALQHVGSHELIHETRVRSFRRNVVGNEKPTVHFKSDIVF